MRAVVSFSSSIAGLLVGVLRGDDAQLELGGALARLRELGAVLAVASPRTPPPRAAASGRASSARSPARSSSLIRLELLLLQLERALLGGDLRRRAPPPRARVSPICRRSSAIWLSTRLAPRAEERPLALEDLGRPSDRPRAGDVRRESRLRGVGALGLQPRRLGALGVELGAQQVERARRRARPRAAPAPGPASPGRRRARGSRARCRPPGAAPPCG